MYQCRFCHKVKRRKDFPKNCGNGWGISKQCKDCNNKKGRIYRMKRQAEALRTGPLDATEEVSEYAGPPLPPPTTILHT